VNNPINVALGLVNNLLDMSKGKVFNVIESLGTFEGYNPSFYPFHDHLVELPRKIHGPITFFDYS